MSGRDRPELADDPLLSQGEIRLLRGLILGGPLCASSIPASILAELKASGLIHTHNDGANDYAEITPLGVRAVNHITRSAVKAALKWAQGGGSLLDT